MVVRRAPLRWRCWRRLRRHERTRAAGRPGDATAFALTALGFLLLAVGVASAVGVALAPVLARLVAPGFEGEPLALTTSAARVRSS